MSDRVVIVCGGTGGHLTPGIAVAQRWAEQGVECHLIVSQKAIDQSLAEQHPDLHFRVTPGVAFSLHPLRFIRFTIQMLKGFFDARSALKAIEPKAILAFGGFTSVAFGLMANWNNIPLFLHEANRVPGRAVRFLSRFAQHVFTPEGVWLKSLSRVNQSACGFPVRDKVVHTKKVEIREKFGLSSHLKVLVVVGGSQGAAALNQWVQDYQDQLLADGISIFCVTGQGKAKGFQNVQREDSMGNLVEARYFSFYEQMGDLFSVADLVVSRAGAGTIAELKRCLCPSVLIPYPYAADNHQSANARFMEQRGCCLYLEQSKLNELYHEVKAFIFNSWLLTKIRDNLRMQDHKDVALFMIKKIEKELETNGIELQAHAVS